ncbi:recombinase family protein [Prosthecomicrobium sp. N25]|uniref:recombinase family protein n=1 Tax=Prosthecomicrobium sp. N25 TaxID=3129254 RepID=UPI0030772FB1
MPPTTRSLPIRAVVSARHSSDLQRESSIADQVEICRRYIEAQGWRFERTFSDAALSGASGQRPGFQALRTAANRREFDLVVCEAVDRLGRRLADTADLQDILTFNGIRLFTPSLGEITTIHVAVMGMMAQIALKDLGEKTRRGQLGRVLQGRIPSGGERIIEPAEANVVRRIFQDFAVGKTLELIAKELNQGSVPGPGGRPWSNTTLRGQPTRGTGILNNALYVGRLEWNRCAYVKDPQTGKRVARPNPTSAWEVVDVPDLAIVDRELWGRVKVRQGTARTAAIPDSDGRSSLNRAKGPRYLLSGKLRCGACAGVYSVIGLNRFGCASHHRQGVCDNAITTRRDEIEARVMVGLKERLLAPDLLVIFIEEVRKAIESARRTKGEQTAACERDLADVRRKIANLVTAIEDGLYEPSFKDRLATLRSQETDLQSRREPNDGQVLALLTHPRLADAYRRKVETLESALEGANAFEARELLRSMIETVTLSPRADGRLDAVLSGDLATILALSAGARASAVDNRERPEPCGSGRQTKVVAGARFELTTFRL